MRKINDKSSLAVSSFVMDAAVSLWERRYFLNKSKSQGDP